MHWLDLFSQFDIIIHHVPGKFNAIADSLLCYPDLAAVVGSVESGLLAWRLGQLLLVTHRDSSKKWEVLVSMVLCSMMLCCATHEVGIKSVW